MVPFHHNTPQATNSGDSGDSSGEPSKPSCFDFFLILILDFKSGKLA